MPHFRSLLGCLLALGLLTLALAAPASAALDADPLRLVIDEDSIDNGPPPNFFSDVDVNDQIAEIGQRAPLPAFDGGNIGETYTLYTGQLFDEAWFSVEQIPQSWIDAGPTSDGWLNFWLAGPGLGTADGNGDRESQLDNIPGVLPLRTTELESLVGRTVCAVVYDSDISMNYDPPTGSLKGANLGVVSFQVVAVRPRTGASSSSLPEVDVLVADPYLCQAPPPDPGIAIDKKVRRVATDPFVDGPITAKVGDTLEYQFTVTNTGDVPLTVAFDDERCDVEPTAPDSGDTDADGKLDTSETWIYTCSHVVLAGDDDPFTNHACVVGTPPVGGTVEDCDDTTTDILNPDIELDKQVSTSAAGPFSDGPVEARRDDTLYYQFTVTNEGDVPLSVVLTDARCDSAPVLASGDTDADGKLDVTEMWVYTCSHVVQSDDDDPFHNHACVVGTDPLGQTDEDCDDTTTDLLDPGIEIDKKLRNGSSGVFVDGPISVHVGDTIEYEFTVTNDGDTALTVVFDDPRCDVEPIAPDSGDADNDGKLDLSETWIYTCSHLVTNGDPDPLPNTATVTGTDSLGQTDSDDDSALADILPPDTELDRPGINIEKTVRVGALGSFSESVQAHVGDTLEYRFVITNTGEVPLDVVFSDPRCDSGTVTGPTGDTDGDTLLDTTETWLMGCTHALTTADLAAGSTFPNTATVTGTGPQGGTVQDDDDATATILDPGIKIDKLVRVGDSDAFADSVTVDVGQTLTYQLTVTNTGNTPLAVNVSDPRCDSSPAFQSGDSDGDNFLDVSETWVFTCTHVVTAGDPDPLVNTATATGTDEIGRTVADDDTANADILPALTGALPEVAASPGRASLVGRSGCVGRVFTARVSGRSIVKVVFRIDGKTVKTLRKPNSGSRFTYKVDPRRFKVGAHRLEATVFFTKASGTKAKRLRVTFLRCSRKAAPPRFTG